MKKPWQEPRIFAAFGIGPKNIMQRADGTYRKLSRSERLVWVLFERLPRDKYTKGAFE